jgi:hypothetical protein
MSSLPEMRAAPETGGEANPGDSHPLQMKQLNCESRKWSILLSHQTFAII